MFEAGDVKTDRAGEVLDCPECHFRKDLCLCAAVPVIESRARFFLLVHPRELSKFSNTGHLVVNSLIGAVYDSWSRVESSASLMALLAESKYQPYVVFPAERLSSIEVTVVEEVSLAKPPLFILLEGTWQEAAKMYRQSPYLHKLPVLSLKPQHVSEYRLRRNQKAEGLATVEIAIELLERLHESPQANQLHAYFQQFLLHYEAQRSQRAL